MRLTNQCCVWSHNLDAETLLTRVKVSYYNALYDYNIALAQVNWASGYLIQKYSL